MYSEKVSCPRCGHPLKKVFYEGKIVYDCPQGHGCAITLSAIRGLCGTPDFANMLWHMASGSPSGVGGACPVCHKPMKLIRLPQNAGNLELDICCACQEIWFDPNELEALPKPPPLPREPELPQKAKEVLAEYAVTRIQQHHLSQQAPVFGWKYLAGLFGFPIKNGAPVLKQLPWCTWIISALCIAAFFFSIKNPECISKWGLIPNEYLRHYGFTFITSMFLHCDIVHLVGNLYFFLIFGDNVEDALGKAKFLWVILISGLVASLFHIAIFPASGIPCIGASGFISGVLASYVVFFPKVTIHLCFRWGFAYRWLGVPAWCAFALWMMYQILMGIATKNNEAGIAFWAHIGGALTGLVFGFQLRRTLCSPRR